MKTGAQVIEEMRRRGETVTAWANKNGFTFQQVQNVIHGRAKGNWGKSHAVAVKLGMKKGEIINS
ncbi:MAG: DNA-binding protein [Gallionella sp.]|nr:DNA-binding protein [Gallionella sp.]